MFKKATSVVSDEYYRYGADLLGQAGITINGNKDYDVQVRDLRVFKRVFAQGEMGLGEAYMDHWWDCDRIDKLVHRLFTAGLSKKIPKNPKMILYFLAQKIFNEGRFSKSFEVGERHYDLNTELFVQMLDKRMVYSCGYWREADNLEKAQEDKLNLICQKLMLRPGMKLLDIGCGWGSLLKFAAERFGVEGVGITISKEQAEFAQNSCRGLPIKILFQDYRSLTGEYDAIASVGMIEHVGTKNYRIFMDIVANCLKDQGIFLLQTIGKNNSKPNLNPWAKKIYLS